jgi:predicted CXXCH cytochrome family protein
MGGIAILVVQLAVSCSDTIPEADDSGAVEADLPEVPAKLAAVSVVTDPLAAGLIGSRHDFRQLGGRPLDLCTPCHTPHLSVAPSPLLDPRPIAAQRLRPYTALGVELDDSSLLCLSCHDGVVAKDVYGSAHAISGQIASSWVGAASLSSHPIGVKYPLADSKYQPIEAVTSDGRVKLPEGRVQCISCHDPHNTRRHDHMLVRSNEGSRLCLSCHRI